MVAALVGARRPRTLTPPWSTRAFDDPWARAHDGTRLLARFLVVRGPNTRVAKILTAAALDDVLPETAELTIPKQN